MISKLFRNNVSIFLKL